MVIKMHVIHNLKPIFNKNSKILILGSMPSIKSRELGFYYAHPQNRFWQILEILFEIKLETKEEKMYNEHGEIYITGPSIMGGYFNNDTQTKLMIENDEFNNPWVKTGDIGYIDKDGCIFIEDRIKNMIIRPDWFKVYPLTIESIILKHPGIYTCKVVGVSQPSYSIGKFPLAYIVIKDEYKNSTENIVRELNELCLNNLPEYQIPIDFIVKDTLPYTSIGKVDTNTLENEYNSKINYSSLVRKK